MTKLATKTDKMHINKQNVFLEKHNEEGSDWLDNAGKQKDENVLPVQSPVANLVHICYSWAMLN